MVYMATVKKKKTRESEDVCDSGLPPAKMLFPKTGVQKQEAEEQQIPIPNAEDKTKNKELMVIQERNNLELLKEIVEMASKIFDIKEIELIGGLNTRTSTSPSNWRHTHDLDFAARTEEMNSIIGMIKSLGYEYIKSKKFGGMHFKKSIQIGDKEVTHDVHVALDLIYDMSTNRMYVLKEINGVEKQVKPMFDENKGLEITVKAAPIEDMVLMKSMTIREKDWKDVYYLLLDAFDEIDKEKIVEKCLYSNEMERKYNPESSKFVSFQAHIIDHWERMKKHVEKLDKSWLEETKHVLIGRLDKLIDVLKKTLPENEAKELGERYEWPEIKEAEKENGPSEI